MKIVTNDYGCGTSSSILDYGIHDVVVVSEENYEHVFEQEDDLLFIGHDFLFYLWNDEEKMKRWKSYSEKHELWVWCFERIDAIVPQWRQKSHVSISIASNFCKRILACDEDDCDKYGFDWLPQWASRKFFDRRDAKPSTDKILFSGQAGGPEYQLRNELLTSIKKDQQLSEVVEITNVKRSFDWDSYVENFLKHQTILNPIGVLKALNTRAYECLYSGRLLFQQTAGEYRRHKEMLKNCPSVKFFNDHNDLKRIVMEKESMKESSEVSFREHSLFARMKSIGVDIK